MGFILPAGLPCVLGGMGREQGDVSGAMEGARSLCGAQAICEMCWKQGQRRLMAGLGVLSPTPLPQFRAVLGTRPMWAASAARGCEPLSGSLLLPSPPCLRLSLAHSALTQVLRLAPRKCALSCLRSRDTSIDPGGAGKLGRSARWARSQGHRGQHPQPWGEPFLLCRLFGLR